MCRVGTYTNEKLLQAVQIFKIGIWVEISVLGSPESKKVIFDTYVSIKCIGNRTKDTVVTRMFLMLKWTASLCTT